jgi:hypothetical protein
VIEKDLAGFEGLMEAMRTRNLQKSIHSVAHKSVVSRISTNCLRSHSKVNRNEMEIKFFHSEAALLCEASLSMVSKRKKDGRKLELVRKNTFVMDDLGPKSGGAGRENVRGG